MCLLALFHVTLESNIWQATCVCDCIVNSKHGILFLKALEIDKWKNTLLAITLSWWTRSWYNFLLFVLIVLLENGKVESRPHFSCTQKKKYSAILKRYLLTLMLDLQLSRKHNHAQLSVLSSYEKFDQAEQRIGIYGKMLVQCQPSLQSHHLIEKKLASATRSCHCLCGRQLLMPLPTIHATRPSIDITHTTISRRFNIPLTLHFIFEAQIFLIHKVKVPSCITRTPAHCKIYYIQILIKKKKKYAYPRFAARARRRLTMWLCRDIGLGYGYYLTQCLFFFLTFFFFWSHSKISLFFPAPKIECWTTTTVAAAPAAAL